MKETCKVEQLLNLAKQVSFEEFDAFIINFLERKAHKQLALHELDALLSALSNFSFNLSLYLKQNYLLNKEPQPVREREPAYFTKKEVARKYGVDVRTVSNWIRDGLKAIEIGGVVRITKEALERFVNENKSKKFSWKSIVKVRA